MKRLTSNRNGLVMLAVMFLVALLIPLIYIGTYFRLANQQETFQRSIQDKQLYWALVGTINRTKFELQSAVAQYKLDGGQFLPNTRVSLLDTPMDNWLNGVHGFKDSFHSFLSNYPHAGSVAGQNIEFALDDCADRCFAITRSNDGEAGLFTLEARVRLPATDLTGAIRQMRQSLYITTSNLADFAVFYYNNFDTSPGTNTTYQGPMYVNKKATLTPNQGATLKLTFKEGDENPYSLKAHEIQWFSLRDYGCDPYRMSDCERDNTTGEFVNHGNNWEKDLDGKPVFYYYNSNNQPGWVDGSDSNSTIDPEEKSTILVKDKLDENFDGVLNTEHFSELIGLNRSAPIRRDYTFRGAPPLKLMNSVYISTNNIGLDGDVANTTLAYNGSNPLDPFTNPNWSSYINTNFLRNGKMLFTDNAEAVTLQLGGAQNPHELIDVATDTERDNPNDPRRRTKLHWLARLPSNSYESLAINFDLLFCRCHEYLQADYCDSLVAAAYPNCSEPQNASYLDEDPLIWNQHVSNDGFIDFDGNSYPYFLESYLVNQSKNGASLSNRFMDLRRGTDSSSTTLMLITIDVARLKRLIQNGSNDARHSATVFGQHGSNTRDKPFLLYLGLRGDGSFVSQSDKFKFAVRLLNADQLPDNGLTIATNGFVQVLGDYNTEEPQQNTIPAINHCEMKPAAILADQVMSLSKSWQDWPQNINVPAQYTDPYDHRTYSSPENPQSHQTYFWNDYKSHPVRCNIANDPNCADTRINAMLITGNIPNKLITQAQYETDNWKLFDTNHNNALDIWEGVAEPYYFCYLTGICWDLMPWQTPSDRLVGYGGNQPQSGAYASKADIKNENFTSICITQIDHNPTVNPSVNQCIHDTITNNSCIRTDADYPVLTGNCAALCNQNDANYPQCIQDCGVKAQCIQACSPNGQTNGPIDQCKETRFNNIPVRIITSYDGSDNPVYYAPPLTAGALFSSATCPSCGGNVPLYLTVNEQGQIDYTVTQNIETGHIKSYNTGDPNNQNSLDHYRNSNNPSFRIRPGTRYASLATSDPYFPDGVSSPYLFPDTWVDATPHYDCCYANGNQCNQIPTGHHDCDDLPSDCGNEACCGTYCPECPNGICGSGDAGCTGTPICDPNSCMATGYRCPAESGCQTSCPPSTRTLRTSRPDPNAVTIIYTKGSRYRFMYSSNNSEWYKQQKRQYMYLEAYHPVYDGGHENLVRYNENWNAWDCNCAGNNCQNQCTETADRNKITILGTMHALWTAQTLVRPDGQPAYWTSSTYAAPEREFLYATSLRNDFCKPPGIPTSIVVRTEGQDQQ